MSDPLAGLTHGTTLVLGGARSGKSRFAASVARATGLARLYVATATVAPGDDDMQARIERHRADRDAGWEVVEEPLDVAAVVRERSDRDHVLVVDCLTLWLTNVMYGDAGPDVEDATRGLLGSIERATGPIVLVSNEVGLGVHPPSTSGRDFRDAQGRLNQQVAAVVDHVRLTVAGIPVVVKG